MLPFSNITPGGGVVVQGQNFASPDGSFGQFQLILSSGETYPLENVQWGDTFAAGTIRAYWGPELDTQGVLRIVRSDGTISNPLPVGFTATRDFNVLPPADMQIICVQGADNNYCPAPGDSSSASGLHDTQWGHDMGLDRFNAALQNGWVFYQMDFAQVEGINGGVQPPPGFTPLSNKVQLAVYWDQEGGSLEFSHGATTWYDINLYIMGPKGTPWNRPLG
jgi:hypothetical protein